MRALPVAEAERGPKRPVVGYGPPSAPVASSCYRAFDDAPLSHKHWLTVLVSGMGFFTDAYDLFIIGTVTVLLTPIWHLSTNQVSLLNSASLLASVAGALVFGKLMDHLGRVSMYAAGVTILAVGALLTAFSWDFWSLLGFRLVVGFGVGGDYPASAVVSAEYANRAQRGRLVGTVFAMQGFGLLAGPAIASVLLASGAPTSVAWRLMLGLGAVPATSVIYLRLRIKESPRFSLGVKGDVAALAETAQWFTGEVVNDKVGALAMPSPGPAAPSPGPAAPKTAKGRHGGSRLAVLGERRVLMRLVGAAGCWFLMDIAFYGNSISNPLLLKALQPRGSLLSHTLLSGGIFLFSAVPGYWTAVWLLDKVGRRRIQWQGFAVMALAFGAIALLPGATKQVWEFLALFALSYFFVEFGPNMTTFVYPSEIFATNVRGSATGIAASAGKIGAFVGALLVPHMIKWVGVTGVMGAMALISLVGLLLTVAVLPEPMGRSLEDASGELDITGLDELGPVVKPLTVPVTLGDASEAVPVAARHLVPGICPQLEGQQR
ncbi:MAG: MFS transporter [Acidimicrobiales bacterium]